MGASRWNVAEAKAKLSEVLSQASREPQVIENRGREVAVVLSIKDYQELKSLQVRAAPQVRLAEFLRFTEQLREDGGAEIKLPKREPRPSPFSDGRRR